MYSTEGFYGKSESKEMILFWNYILSWEMSSVSLFQEIPRETGVFFLLIFFVLGLNI